MEIEYEIDFLPVGEESKGGDAICFRFWEPGQTPFVGVIDGGTKDSGKMMVDYIRSHYGTDHVDMVIASHLHADHISGLTVVLEKLNVDVLMMHKPWEHEGSVSSQYRSGKLALSSLSEAKQKSLPQAIGLLDLAEAEGIPVVEPLAGGAPTSYIQFLGPTEEYYEKLLTECKRRVKSGTLNAPE